jgi:aerobic carbon-monoxide dehydrogenase small subunit
MRTIELTINGESVRETVSERTHLADFLREHLTLTATHLRCEQGVCGACTLLIDGVPARSCITYAALCEGAEITTLEGLEDDPIVAALRRAFSAEHGLQCGFCTPGMLVTARDIVMRLPDADEARVRLELAGNLCRCTGYAGIVRAIRRVLQDRAVRGRHPPRHPPRKGLGPVGARVARRRGNASPVAPPGAAANDLPSPSLLPAQGLGARPPNIVFKQSFSLAERPERVWSLLSDPERVARCMPGAMLVGPVEGDRVRGRMVVRLGPITASFDGEALLMRDDASRRGTIAGSASERITRSRVVAELGYAVRQRASGSGSDVDLDLRALLTGPLAQFSRGGIVSEVAARLTGMFAANLQRALAGEEEGTGRAALGTGSLIGGVLLARLRAWGRRVWQRLGHRA